MTKRGRERERELAACKGKEYRRSIGERPRPCDCTRRTESGGRNRSAGSSVYYVHRASLPEPSPRGLRTQ